jgi:hypothetical protein
VRTEDNIAHFVMLEVASLSHDNNIRLPGMNPLAQKLRRHAGSMDFEWTGLPIEDRTLEDEITLIERISHRGEPVPSLSHRLGNSSAGQR